MKFATSDEAATELAAMSQQLEEYLLDEQLFKTIGVPAQRGQMLIKMTIGAMLERMAYLTAARAAPEVVTAARAALDLARSKMADRYIARLAREAKSYTDSWNWFLQECWDGKEGCAADYATEVPTRLRLARLLEEGGTRPELADTRNRLQSLDERLRAIWQADGEPILDLPPEQYPRERYWWLYGGPVPQRD